MLKDREAKKKTVDDQGSRADRRRDINEGTTSTAAARIENERR
jgi:hypothetical protein